MGGLFSILDPILGSNDLSGTRNAIDQNRALYENIKLPEFKEYIPELYNPESANYSLTSDDPITKSLQMSALAKMSGLADTGLSDADRAGYQQAINDGNQQAKSQTAAIMQNAQARGVGGSGLEMMMREQAGQDGAQRAQQAGLQVAGDAAKQRALYNQAFAQGTSNLRDQDARTNTANANIINNFNQANTQARNTANQYNVQNRNQAVQYNDNMKQRNYENQTGKANSIAGINTQIGNTFAAENAANNQRNSAILGAGIGALGGMFKGGGGATPKPGTSAGGSWDDPSNFV